ncbi:MAG: DUF4262 domain-containing protein [Candidatus Kapaibacterium sp.]
MNSEDIQSIIDSHGWFVALFEGQDDIPSFGYTIGLFDNYGLPEVVLFGLEVEDLHQAINDAASQMVEEGTIDCLDENHSILDEVMIRSIEVSPLNIPEYFGYAVEFYQKPFPVFQLIWSDFNGNFPWDDGFAEDLKSLQPLLYRSLRYKYVEPPDMGVFTTRQHLEEGKAILMVLHDEEGDWQFLTGDQLPEDARIVSLRSLVERDDSLNDVFDLGFGEYAERDSVDEKWRRVAY